MRRLDDTRSIPRSPPRSRRSTRPWPASRSTPEYAELAELALLLAAERPQPEAEFADALDERVAAPVRARRVGRARRRGGPRRRWLGAARRGGGGRWRRRSRGGRGARRRSRLACRLDLGRRRRRRRPARRPRRRPAALGAARTARRRPPRSARGQRVGGRRAASTAVARAAVALARSPQLPPNGRKIVQSAQLALSTAPSHDRRRRPGGVQRRRRAERDRQQLAGHRDRQPSGYAQFQLSVPSAQPGRRR